MPHLLLVESGSTKSQWRLLDAQGKILADAQTDGFNPNIQHPDAIEAQVAQQALPALKLHLAQGLQRIRFYGASFNCPAYNQPFAELLGRYFGCSDVIVEHDILAAARATCGNQPGIACILGTGSNSCHYDGTRVTRIVGGHGYVFGDEGSGADLGKALLKTLLDEPTDPRYQPMRQALETHVGQPLLAYRNFLYNHPKPNVELARLAHFIEAQLPQTQWLAALVQSRLAAFLHTTVRHYPEAVDLPVHFVGSIARVFWPLVSQALAAGGWREGVCVARPLDALTDYHRQHPEA